MKKIITFSFVFFVAVILNAQEKISEKNLYSLDIIRWENQWLSSKNYSGLTFNEGILKNFNSFTDASISAKYDFGSYRNIFDPETNFGGLFNVESYSKLGNVFLYGRFGYNYSFMTGSRWRGLVNPYETPFMMTDSIPGNMSFELYSMEAGLGVPIGEHFSLGVGVKYDIGLMAKHKDLRNKNTYMNFDISPGFIFRSQNVNAGLNVGYIRNTERVEYKQIDQSTEKYLFNLYGMWLYYSSGFSNSGSSRRKENSDYYASLQLNLKFGEFSLFNNFNADYHYGIQTEVGYNNLIHGEVNQLTYSDMLILQYGNQHRVTGEVSFYKMLGNKYLQRQELDPDSNIRMWVSYGGPINCYVRDFGYMNFNYTFRKALSSTDIRWEATAGYRNTKISNKYKESPIHFTQDYNINEIYLSGIKYFRVKKSSFEIEPQAAFFPQGKKLNANTVKNIETGEILDNESYQLMAPLNQEYAFWSARKISAGVDFRYSYLPDVRKNLRIYINAGYNIHSTLNENTASSYRHRLALTVGLAF
jgi:hypothetical protein